MDYGISLSTFTKLSLTSQEQDRLSVKFRHQHAGTTASNTSSSHVGKDSHTESLPSPTKGILKKSNSKVQVVTCINPSPVPGRLTLKSAFNRNNSQDDLSIHDNEKCNALLDNYRKLVLNGDICSGNCPNDGISCTTGVCRAHLR